MMLLISILIIVVLKDLMSLNNITDMASPKFTFSLRRRKTQQLGYYQQIFHRNPVKNHQQMVG